MIKVLLKKQIAESLAFITVNRKNGASRSKGAIVAYCVLFIYVFAVFGFMFYSLSETLLIPFSALDMEWLAFSVMAMIAVAFGIFTGVFTIHSSVYEPKDNELLLAMPIKPSHILFARLISCYVSMFFVQALVLVPSAVFYIVNIHVSAAFILLFLLALVLLPLITLCVSCILGYLLALLIARFNCKSAVTTAASVLFLLGYYYIYFQGQKYLDYVMSNTARVGATVKTVFYPFYCFGKAVFGDPECIVFYALIMVLPFACVYLLLSKSFIGLATAKRGSSKKTYVAKWAKPKTPFAALFGKELWRFLRTSVYMLNCGLASLLMIAVAVFMIVKAESVKQLAAAFLPILGDATVTLLLCGALGFLISMNAITAPSISLEGKCIVLLKSLPVKGFTVVMAKISLHLLFTCIPSLIAAAVASVIVPISGVCIVLLLAFSQLFPLFTACLGMIVNLKMPNFTWTSEAAAVKQGASVIISMLGSMAPLLGLVLLFIFAPSWLSPMAILITGVCVIALAAVSMLAVLKNKADKWILDL